MAAKDQERRRQYMREYRKAWHDRNRERINKAQRRRYAERRAARLLEETGHRELPEGLKQCWRCRQARPLAEFYPRKPTKRHPTTHRSWCKACEASYTQTARQGNARYLKDWKLRTRFGITLDEYERMEAEQHGACAICGKTPADDVMKHSLAVDHNHKTGRIRGLLCRHCNIGLGKLGDDIENIQRVLDYLKRSGSVNGSG